MSAPVVLYADPFWVSPYVFSSFVALREKNIEFDVITIDLGKGEHRREPFRSASLTARVPALDDHGFWLSESNAIAEYLEESYPPPAHQRLFPADPRQRARARQLMAFLRSDLGALRDERSSEMVFYDTAGPPMSEAARRSAGKLIEVAEQLIPAGAETAFDEWSVADADLALALLRIAHDRQGPQGEDRDASLLPPRLRAYAALQWARPSVRAYVEHPRAPFVPYNYGV
jgi:glutathione S-transferase